MWKRKKSVAPSVNSDMMNKQRRFEALVDAFQTDLYRFAYWLCQDKAIAEDVVQETFLRAWKSLHALKDEKAAKSWLITILRRENARRFERKQFDLVDVDDVVLVDDSISHEAGIHHREIRREIAALSSEYREPLVMQIILGMSGDEIAAELGLNKNTVMTRLFRARNQLKEKLENPVTLGGHQHG